MRDKLTGLYAVLESVISLFDKLLVTENAKLDAIAVNDVDKLDEYMRAEQAFTMELRSLDAKREKIQAELGFDGLTLSGIVDSLPQGESEKLSDIMEQLQQRTDELTVAVNCTKNLIELHLQSLDIVLESMGSQVKRDVSYESTGEKNEEVNVPPKFSSKKV